MKPKLGEGDDMAAVINDGLELYARELQQVRGLPAHTTTRPKGSAAARPAPPCSQQGVASAAAGLAASWREALRCAAPCCTARQPCPRTLLNRPAPLPPSLPSRPQINTGRRASQPVAAGSGSQVGSYSGSFVGSAAAARPPRAPPGGAGKKSNFYPSSLPKGGGHTQSRMRPFGQSPPSVSVGAWPRVQWEGGGRHGG